VCVCVCVCVCVRARVCVCDFAALTTVSIFVCSVPSLRMTTASSPGQLALALEMLAAAAVARLPLMQPFQKPTSGARVQVRMCL